MYMASTAATASMASEIIVNIIAFSFLYFFNVILNVILICLLGFPFDDAKVRTFPDT